MTGSPHTTPTRGVPVTLDRVRHLRFSFRVLRELRAELGEDVLTGGQAMQPEIILKLMWYGLKTEDPTLTPEMLEDILDLESLPDLVEAVLRATGMKKKTLEAVPPAPADSVAPKSEPVGDQEAATPEPPTAS